MFFHSPCLVRIPTIPFPKTMTWTLFPSVTSVSTDLSILEKNLNYQSYDFYSLNLNTICHMEFLGQHYIQVGMHIPTTLCSTECWCWSIDLDLLSLVILFLHAFICIMRNFLAVMTLDFLFIKH